MIIHSALILLASLGASSAPADVRDGCAVVAQGYLLAADATNRVQALETAEHEAEIYNHLTSQRLVVARSRAEHLRQSLASRGCSADAFTPAFGRYMLRARACAAVELGHEPTADYAGCDPLTWKA